MRVTLHLLACQWKKAQIQKQELLTAFRGLISQADPPSEGFLEWRPSVSHERRRHQTSPEQLAQKTKKKKSKVLCPGRLGSLSVGGTKIQTLWNTEIPHLGSVGAWNRYDLANWNFLNISRALPNKTRVLRQIAPESSPESAAKSLSQEFFGVPPLSPEENMLFGMVISGHQNLTRRPCLPSPLFLGEEAFLLIVGAFLLTDELLCLQSVELLIRHVLCLLETHTPTVSKKLQLQAKQLQL